MRYWLIAILVVLISFHANSQLTDSASLLVDSSAKQIQSNAETAEDSIYRRKMERNIEEKGQDLDKFLADYKTYKEKEKRQTYIRIGVGILFAVALVYGVIRKRKITKRSGR